MCTHMMQYVEVCDLLARAQETYYIVKQLAIFFCDKRNMASIFQHLAGYKDGTGTFCCYGKSRRQPDRPLAAERPNTGRSMRTD